MVVGDPFVYFLIVAGVLPLLWIAWWAADSVFRSPRAVHEVMPAPKGPKAPSYDYPRAVDMTLPRRRGAVSIYSLQERAEVDSCHGADVTGRCPRATADGTVACAGLLLALPMRIRGSAEWQIPNGYKVCPIASYEVYRQTSPRQLHAVT